MSLNILILYGASQLEEKRKEANHMSNDKTMLPKIEKVEINGKEYKIINGLEPRKFRLNDKLYFGYFARAVNRNDPGREFLIHWPLPLDPFLSNKEENSFDPTRCVVIEELTKEFHL